MISCTEFIPLYSELFKFLEKKGGKEEVIKYWEHISDEYVEKNLGKEIKKHGLKGCWNYWSRSLNEEACDFTMTLDEDDNYFEINMKGCPSKGMLLKMDYTNPYDDYCGHCDVLYKRCAARYGIDITCDLSKCDKAQCILAGRRRNG